MTHKSEASLKLSTYITAGSVTRYFGRSRARNAAIRHLEYMGVTKAYLEVYRGGLLLDTSTLSSVKEHLGRAGLEVSGGIATTHGHDFTEKSTRGPYWICYSSEKSLQNLERVARTAAGVFDEVIVDDFLCTACHCPRCRAAKGEQDWPEFYRDLLVKYAERALIGPAKEENPDIKLIIKYPQWYDRFHDFGYDVVRQSEAFDAVWVGTEIRDPSVDYVHQYEPFANYSYLRSVAGSKVEGAWFDFLWCYPEIYLEQAYQSLLAGASELVLFSYSPTKYTRRNPNASAFVRKRETLDRVCSAVRGMTSYGIEAYKPPNSAPGCESFLFDYMGMLGLPVIVTGRRPTSPSICLSTHSLADPTIAQFLRSQGSGRAILATSGFLEGSARDEELLEIFGLSANPVVRKEFTAYRFAARGARHSAEERVLFRSYLRPSEAEVLAEAIDGRKYPIMTLHRSRGTTYIGACLDTFRYSRHQGSQVTAAEPVSLLHLPRGLLDLLRNVLLSPLGVSFRAPGKVGLYLCRAHGQDSRALVAIENFRDQEVDVGLGGLFKLKRVAGNCQCSEKDGQVGIRVPRRELVLLASRQGAT